MNIDTYIHTYIQTYTHIHTYIRTYITYITYIYIYIHTHTHARTYTCTYTYQHCFQGEGVGRRISVSSLHLRRRGWQIKVEPVDQHIRQCPRVYWSYTYLGMHRTPTHIHTYRSDSRHWAHVSTGIRHMSMQG